MKTLIKHLFEKVRMSAWAVPTFLVLGAIVLSAFTLWVDSSHGGDFLYQIPGLNPVTAEPARAFLSTVATSLLTLTGVAFSSMIVVLVLASQQFGPRLLRNFIRDQVNQKVLGGLLGSFVYCLLIMRSVTSEGGFEWVPQISMLVAFLLVIVCLGLFIHFIQHVVKQIQAEQVCANAYGVLMESIDAIFDEERSGPDILLEDPPKGWGVRAGKRGFVQAINHAALVSLAEEAELVIRVQERCGFFVNDVDEIFEVTTADGERPSDELVGRIQSNLLVGAVRTNEQDLEFGIRQLVEIAMRGLSPGINDPFTAMDCIDYLGAGLQIALQRRLPASYHYDEKGELRLIASVSDYAGIVDAAFNEIRQFGSEHCNVSCRILEAIIRCLKQPIRAEARAALIRQADLVKDAALSQLKAGYDREAIESRYEVILKLKGQYEEAFSG